MGIARRQMKNIDDLTEELVRQSDQLTRRHYCGFESHRGYQMIGSIAVYHVIGYKRSNVLYGTFSTHKRAEEYMKKLEASPTAGYNYGFKIEEAKLDPEF